MSQYPRQIPGTSNAAYGKKRPARKLTTQKRIINLFGLQNHAKLTRLISDWRWQAQNYRPFDMRSYHRIRRCADELEALLK